MKTLKVIDKIGCNYHIENCPVLIPEENIDIMNQISDAAEKSK